MDFNQWSSFTPDGTPTEIGGNVNAHVQLKNSWWVHAGTTRNAVLPSYCDNCARGGPAVRQDPAASGWVGIEGDNRRRITPALWTMYFASDAGHSHGFDLNPSLGVRFSDRLNASLGMDYQHNINATQWVQNDGALLSDTTHFTFARLDQRVLAVTTRVNFTVTPTLSFQLYASPFVTSGAFDDWMELADPRAKSYALRYASYGNGASPEGFNFKQFRSNAVVRWEYRPGSTIYVVWAQERTDDLANLGTFDAGRDYHTLFASRPANVLLIKGSYWVSF